MSKPPKDASSGDEDDNKNENESEDDEPLAKKAKPSPPTVRFLETNIRSIYLTSFCFLLS